MYCRNWHSIIICYNNQKTTNFLKKALTAELSGTPLHYALTIIQRHNKKTWKYIQSVQNNPDLNNLTKIIQECQIADSTRFTTYKNFNPNLEIHVVYKNQSSFEERTRITFTRLRLSSHHLKIETGRWSRLPPHERLCDCNIGSIQDEQHALLHCQKTEHLRQKYGRLNFASLQHLVSDQNINNMLLYCDEAYSCMIKHTDAEYASSSLSRSN